MLVRRLARPMLGSLFIAAGSETVRQPSAAAPAAEPVVAKVLAALPDQVSQRLPRDPELYVRANGAAQVVAGLALASGNFPRLSSLVLAGSLVPTTLAGHAFWQESDPRAKAEQRIHFLKNLSILGGLIIAGVDNEGRPGLSWRARRAASDAAAAVAAVVPGGAQPSHALADRAHELGDASRAFAESAGERWAEASAALEDKTAELSKKARKKAPKLAKSARKQAEEFAKVASERADEFAALAAKRAAELEKTTADWGDQAAEWGEKARKKAPKLAKSARKQAEEFAKVASKRADEFAELASERAAEFEKATTKGREQLEALAAEQRPKLRKFFQR